MRKQDDWFDELMREYALRLDRQIEEEERQWRDKVPERLDKRIEAMVSGAEPAVYVLDTLRQAPPAGSGGRLAARAAKVRRAAAGKLLAVALASAVAVGAGTYAVSPAVRGYVDGVLSAERTAHAVLAGNTRRPGEYVIPSPGEGFTVTEEAQGENMHGCWFTSDDREVLVQIANALPEGAEAGENAEPVLVGGVMGTVEDAGDTEVLILNDGGVMLRVEFWGADREELIDYAGRLLSANHSQEETR